MLGNTIDGTRAEFVRTPYVDSSLYRIPKGVDEEALVMLSDILPTGSSGVVTIARRFVGHRPRWWAFYKGFPLSHIKRVEKPAARQANRRYRWA